MLRKSSGKDFLHPNAYEKNYPPEQSAQEDSSIQNNNQVIDYQLWDSHP